MRVVGFFVCHLEEPYYLGSPSWAAICFCATGHFCAPYGIYLQSALAVMGRLDPGSKADPEGRLLTYSSSKRSPRGSALCTRQACSVRCGFIIPTIMSR